MQGQAICNPVLPWTCGKPGEKILSNLITSLLGLALVVAGLLSFGYLVIGGMQWITSAGDKAALEAARNRIMHAIIGLVLVASTWAISTLVFNWLGIPFPNINIPTINRQASPATPAQCTPNAGCARDPNFCSTYNMGFCQEFGSRGWYCCN